MLPLVGWEPGPVDPAERCRGTMFDNSAATRRPRQPCSTSSAEVRTRWRMKLALRGAVAVAGIASGCSSSPPTGWSGRGSAARRSSPRASRCWSCLRPRPTGSCSCRCGAESPTSRWRCISEHEPSLQATLLSAVESSRAATSRSPLRWFAASSSRRSTRASAWRRRSASSSSRRDAMQRARRRRPDRAPRSGDWSGVSARRDVGDAAALVGCRGRSPYRSRHAGSVTVPKGADQTISGAKLLGFDSEDVDDARAAHAGRTVRVAAAGAQRKRRLRRYDFRRECTGHVSGRRRRRTPWCTS